MSSDDIAIRIDGLGKCYRLYRRPQDRLKHALLPRLQRLFGNQAPIQYGREFWALRNISCAIKRGETVGILGRNGSGKSTLLQMIAGTLTPTCGTVEIHGRVAALLELGSGFNYEFTGRENVYLNGAVLGLTHEEIRYRFDDIAAFAEIGEFMDQPVKSYSSGMLVRLGFAISVCVEPEVLIVDEALAVGDASFQFKCLERLERLTSNGTTLLFVSHDVGMMKRFCHRVLYLHQGQVRAEGAPEEMVELYFMDMRDGQRRLATGGAVGVATKPFLGAGSGIAFGTEEGYITAATFIDSSTTYSSYLYGENVEIRIEVKFRSTITHPCVAVAVQESRLLAIGGGVFPVSDIARGDGWEMATISLRFRAALATGRYHVTVRLQNGDSTGSFQLVDKQVALLAFDVINAETSFLGIVNLGIEQIPVSVSNKTRVGSPQT